MQKEETVPFFGGTESQRRLSPFSSAFLHAGRAKNPAFCLIMFEAFFKERDRDRKPPGTAGEKFEIYPLHVLIFTQISV